jgi:hypothetical protein
MGRVDFIFSYWIFIWYLLYYFKFIKYSPKWALTFGIIQNLLLLYLLIFYNSWVNALAFCLLNTFIKIIPLWTLRNENYNISGIFYFIILYAIYLVWLKINRVELKHVSPDEIYLKMKKWASKDGIGPGTDYLKSLTNIK